MYEFCFLLFFDNEFVLLSTNISVISIYTLRLDKEKEYYSDIYLK